MTAISHKQYRKLKLNVTLTKPSKVLYDPANQSLPVLGEFVGTLTFRDKSYSQRIFVVTGLKNNLLGLPAIEALGLVVRIDTVSGQWRMEEGGGGHKGPVPPPPPPPPPPPVK